MLDAFSKSDVIRIGFLEIWSFNSLSSVGLISTGIDDHVYNLGPRGSPEGASFDSPSVRFELENFNVRTLYDKLEDQTLHVSSQLARHQSDLRAFYDRISQQAEKLKGMLDNIDVSALIKATKEAGKARPSEVRC